MLWYSDPTDSETPTGFEWNAIGETRSRGNFGLFGYATRLTSRIECTDVGCNPDTSIIGGTCGDNGYCERNQETNNTECICTEFASGYFCEHSPWDDYVTDMTDLLETYVENATSYEEFLAAATENETETIESEYYVRYFGECFQCYGGKSSDQYHR